MHLSDPTRPPITPRQWQYIVRFAVFTAILFRALIGTSGCANDGNPTAVYAQDKFE